MYLIVKPSYYFQFIFCALLQGQTCRSKTRKCCAGSSPAHNPTQFVSLKRTILPQSALTAFAVKCHNKSLHSAQSIAILGILPRIAMAASRLTSKQSLALRLAQASNNKVLLRVLRSKQQFKSCLRFALASSKGFTVLWHLAQIFPHVRTALMVKSHGCKSEPKPVPYGWPEP